MRLFHRVALSLSLLLALTGPAPARDKKPAPSHKDTPATAQPAPAVSAPAPAQGGATAEPPPVEPQQAAAPLDPKDAEIKNAVEAGFAAATKGPAKVPLIDQASIDIPANEAFIPKAQGLRLLRAFGNSPDADGMMGLVVGVGDSDDWIVIVRYVKEGYIKDDDAKNWNADELLTSIREGTEEANKDREERGFQPIEVLGWIEKPTYDAVQHRLVWSLSSQQKGAADGARKGVNYNTYALGRDGYFSLNMLTDTGKVEALKPLAKQLLANLAYSPGKRYEDFNSSTDQVAAYGLAALVGGLAVKKLGLLAVGAAFFAKFAKLILLAVAGGGAAVSKFFKRGKKVDGA